MASHSENLALYVVSLPNSSVVVPSGRCKDGAGTELALIPAAPRATDGQDVWRPARPRSARTQAC